jgi:DNA repair protein RecO (recombination protein O)
VCAALSAQDKAALKNQLRSLLHYHSGGKTLRTRQMMMDVQAL